MAQLYFFGKPTMWLVGVEACRCVAEETECAVVHQLVAFPEVIGNTVKCSL